MAGLGLDGLLALSLALHDTVLVGLGFRLGPVVDLPALRATPCRPASGGVGFVFLDYALMYVGIQPTGQTYRWSQSSTAADDNSNVIAPADAPANGRWLKISSAIRWPLNTFGGIDGLLLHQVQQGYLRQVLMHTGEFNEKVLQVRIFAQAPCVAIHWTGDSYQSKSQFQGVLYNVDAAFQLWIASRNYRGGLEALAPPLAAESSIDPGPIVLYGLVKQLLAGANLDLPGVKQTQIVRGSPQFIDEAETRFVFALDVAVQAAEHTENAASDYATPTEIDIQRSIADAHDATVYDPANVVTGGLDVSVGLGLTQAVSAGSAMVNGLVVNYAGTARLFAASSATYRDLLPSGTMSFVSVPVGATPPPITATALRIGLTITDAAGVVADKFIAATNVAYPAPGTPDIVPVS